MAQYLDELKKVRLDKLEAIKKRGTNPYPPIYEKRNKIGECRNLLGQSVKTAGRLISFRGHGKLTFGDLVDESGKIQLMFKEDLLGSDKYKFLELIDMGDFLGVAGTMITTQSGEVTVSVENFELLSKSVHPLPEKWYGLKDEEERIRRRYLDLILNPDAKKNLDMRFLMERKIREFLWQKDFTEVETPVLQNLYGGTNAKPFKTYLNALSQEMYLRVAPELYLKRLIVGGYEKVFEIARNFRNEGMDKAHQPEFTMLEWYIAYADYHVVMDLVEEMMKFLAQELLGTTTVSIGEKKIDIGKSWPRKTVKEVLKNELGIDWDKTSEEQAKELVKRYKVQIPGVWTKNKALYLIFDKVVADTLEGPIWVIDFPREVSPLSKEHRDNPEEFVERFNGFLGGAEIFDGWSEVSSAIEQRQRFEIEQKNMKAGDEESQPLDEDFIESLEYGMPPLGGIGFGVDRLAMLFANTESIRNVIAFPLLRPEVPNGKTEKQDFSQKMVVVIDEKLLGWKIMNTSGHIGAFLGNKMQTDFDTGKFFTTKDGVMLPRNSQHPVVTLKASQGELRKLANEVKKSGLLYIAYVPEMMETSDDAKLARILENKNEKDIEYAGIGIFGPKTEVDNLTKKFPLWE